MSNFYGYLISGKKYIKCGWINEAKQKILKKNPIFFYKCY